MRIDFDEAVRRHEIEAFFQPIVDLRNGRINAIEARVRWNNRNDGLFTAAEIVPAAEDARAEWTMDFAMIAAAAEAVRRLREDGITPLPVAVNITASTGATANFEAQLKEIVSRGELTPATLRLEFPMEAFANSVTMNRLVRQLAYGQYGLVVDHVDSPGLKDAGLAELPVRMIKIHEGLVEEVPDNSVIADRIRDICLAAHERGFHVGAEGVARLGQLDFLRDAGCHEAQGPLISRPRRLADLAFLIKRGSCW